METIDISKIVEWAKPFISETVLIPGDKEPALSVYNIIISEIMSRPCVCCFPARSI